MSETKGFDAERYRARCAEIDTLLNQGSDNSAPELGVVTITDVVEADAAGYTPEARQRPLPRELGYFATNLFPHLR